mmetsp:Transcript_5262/g.13766  ORF Transcript_5262/g.13766 Transcript_5262/m.13766 type:complete len:272 (+) Transcript_5262:647-1462(+)
MVSRWFMSRLSRSRSCFSVAATMSTSFCCSFITTSCKLWIELSSAMMRFSSWDSASSFRSSSAGSSTCSQRGAASSTVGTFELHAPVTCEMARPSTPRIPPLPSSRSPNSSLFAAWPSSGYKLLGDSFCSSSSTILARSKCATSFETLRRRVCVSVMMAISRLSSTIWTPSIKISKIMITCQWLFIGGSLNTEYNPIFTDAKMDVSIDCQAASGSPSMRLCRPDVVCCSAMCSVKEKPSVVISRSDMNGMISRNTCTIMLMSAPSARKPRR